MKNLLMNLTPAFIFDFLIAGMSRSANPFCNVSTKKSPPLKDHPGINSFLFSIFFEFLKPLVGLYIYILEPNNSIPDSVISPL